MSNFVVVRRGTSVPTHEEREQIVGNLAGKHLFDLERMLAWPDRLMKSTWWNSAEEDTELAYSPTLASYLTNVWPTEEFPVPFAEHMEAVAEVLYLSRSERYRGVYLLGQEIHFVHDMILLLLDQQVDRLKTVWELDQPYLVDFPADPVLLTRLDAKTQQERTQIGFADWVLETWLPAHLLFYGRKAIEKEQAEKAARIATINGDARRFHAGGPGDLIP